jgi:hypothetical protein
MTPSTTAQSRVALRDVTSADPRDHGGSCARRLGLPGPAGKRLPSPVCPAMIDCVVPLAWEAPLPFEAGDLA